MTRPVTVAILLLGVLGCGHSGQSVVRPEAMKADEAIMAFVAQQGIPSAHVTIQRGDEVILQRGYGSIGPAGRPPDAPSIFPIGSISKQFTPAPG